MVSTLRHVRLFTWLALIVPSLFLSSCRDDHTEDGWDVRPFYPRRSDALCATPGGHLRTANLSGVVAGYLTDAEIDGAVDAGFTRFGSIFPEFATPHGVPVHLQEDYVIYVRGAGWASGYQEGNDVFVCLWSRGTSTVDPGAVFIKRPPDGNYAHWRFTAEPLAPALVHELLHVVIGDPWHARAEWSRI